MSVLSKAYPDIWWKLLKQLDGDCRRDADRLAAGPEVSIAAIADAKPHAAAPRGNSGGEVVDVGS